MPQDPTPRSRPGRRRGVVLGASLVVAAVASSAAASAVLSQPPSPPIADELQAELDEMLAAGLPADHPKAVMLQDEIDEIRAGADADPPTERGVDVGAIVERAREAERAEAAGGSPRATVPAGRAAAADTRAWESGPVECEPVPGLLGADEVAGATCVGVPQPDGTSRYVALGRDGTVRSVHFGPDGVALRLDDTAAGRPVPPGSDVRTTPRGDVIVAPPGQAEVTVEVP